MSTLENHPSIATAEVNPMWSLDDPRIWNAPALKVLHVGDPDDGVLLHPARTLTLDEIQNPNCALFVNALGRLLDVTGGVGIAAVQVGMPIRIFALQVKDFRANEPRKMSLEAAAARGRWPHAFDAYINPKIVERGGGKQIWWEGCMSLPDPAGGSYYYPVIRDLTVRITHVGFDGETYSSMLPAWSARIVQHEMNHLDGVTLLERAEKNRKGEPIRITYQEYEQWGLMMTQEELLAYVRAERGRGA